MLDIIANSDSVELGLRHQTVCTPAKYPRRKRERLPTTIWLLGQDAVTVQREPGLVEEEVPEGCRKNDVCAMSSTSKPRWWSKLCI